MTEQEFLTALMIEVSGAIVSGRSVQEAFDRVAGQGVYENLISDVYDELASRPLDHIHEP